MSERTSPQHRFGFLTGCLTRATASSVPLAEPRPCRLRGKLDGIVDEIDDRLEQQIAVAAYLRDTGDADAQADLLVFGNRLVEVADQAKEIGEPTLPNARSDGCSRYRRAAAAP